MSSSTSFAVEYLKDILNQFHKLKRLADRAMAQISEKDFFATLDDEANSIALIMKHMAGNMGSRWTDFLISDGEKPDRNRDSEFTIEDGETNAALIDRFEAGWQCLFSTIESLTADDLAKTVQIRGEPHSVMEAINRQMTHYAYHVGQLVLLAKHARSSDWQSLSIPRGESQEFNAAMQKGREA